MKNPVLLFPLLLLLNSCYHQKGLLLHVPMENGKAKDISSASHEVLNNGAIPARNRKGKENSAFYFNEGAYLEVHYDSTLDSPDAFTISAWAKSDVASYQEGFIFDLGFASDRHYALSWHERNGVCGGYNNFKIGSFGIEVKNWHHYLLTYDGTEVLFYVDGKLINQRVTTPGTIDDNPLRIGEQSKKKGYRFWRGYIDDVRLYNRALEKKEIKRLAR